MTSYKALKHIIIMGKVAFRLTDPGETVEMCKVYHKAEDHPTYLDNWFPCHPDACGLSGGEIDTIRIHLMNLKFQFPTEESMILPTSELEEKRKAAMGIGGEAHDR